MLNRIIGFEGITIEVCGSWIWAFDSYNCRKELKEMGFKFAEKKKAWYWHSEAFRKKGHKVLSMDDIRSYYGSTEVQTDIGSSIKYKGAAVMMMAVPFIMDRISMIDGE